MAKQRCKHPNVVLTEHGVAADNWVFQDGNLIENVPSEPELTGDITVKCRDCGYWRNFPLRARRPAWVSRLQDVAANHNLRAYFK